jgi:hypothetical protein
MKLLLCLDCQDVIRLIQEDERTCRCGNSGGKYTNDLDAYYFGENAFPIGFANSSLVIALKNQPESGVGKTFEAFVIPKNCPTYKKILKSET